jgi:uncharacterized protein YciI
MKLALCLFLVALLGIGTAVAAEEEMAPQGPSLFVAHLELTLMPEDEGYQDMLGQHIDHLLSLYEAGQLVMAGPFMTEGATSGLLILRTGSLEEATALVEADPSFEAGVVNVLWLRPWWDAFNVHEGKSFSSADLAAMMEAEAEQAAAAAED